MATKKECRLELRKNEITVSICRIGFYIHVLTYDESKRKGTTQRLTKKETNILKELINKC